MEDVDESMQLRLADTGGNAFFPRIQVFGPTGALVTSAQNDVSTNVAFAASASGAYSVVVADATGLNAGNYELHFVHAPGAREGGRLRNGGTVASTLTLGDLDSYTFRARTGEGIQLRLTDINNTGLFPRIVVYAPNGALVTSAQNDDVAVVSFTLGVAGTYTVVATDAVGTGTGPYTLGYVNSGQ